MNSMVGRKREQGQKFLENGQRIPVTYVDVLDTVVTDVKTEEKNNYFAIQMGVGLKRKANKTLLGHAKRASLSEAPNFLKELRISEEEAQNLPNLGDKLSILDIFKPGDIVNVVGTSKGKGFAGGVKRHGFHGGPKTHGQSDRHRAPGAIGQGTTPGRVYKGKRMAGRMGQDKVTVQNLKIVEVTDKEVLIAGLVPGVLGSYIVIKKVGEDKKFVPLYKESSFAEAPAGQAIAADKEPISENSENSDTQSARKSDDQSLKETKPEETLQNKTENQGLEATNEKPAITETQSLTETQSEKTNSGEAKEVVENAK